ncbi:hypothetical protein BD410DRAFT_765350 [Rickenella mellea]|uniref:Uncharacterized protein n=1 Tax=Rickenella mellea TaxID=50990 RepID=A0A4Y7QER1_9AGAM|nr:hypothetical protein BD410DRAFT_765350 [Rickenella mellea]
MPQDRIYFRVNLAPMHTVKNHLSPLPFVFGPAIIAGTGVFASHNTPFQFTSIENLPSPSGRSVRLFFEHLEHFRPYWGAVILAPIAC